MRKLAILLLIVRLGAADDFSEAFRPLRLPKPAKLEKQLGPRLPRGIVIEAAPFDRLVAGLLEPHAGRLEQREKLIAGLSGRRLAAAFKLLAKENADRKKRIAAIEAAYVEHYNEGFSERSAGAKRTRMLASVLLPFYRTLLLRNARVAAAARPGAAGLLASDPALRAAAVRVSDDLQAIRKAAREDKQAGVRFEALNSLLRFEIGAIKRSVIAALDDPAWRVRALAVAICVRARLVEAAGPLIDALGKEQGRLRKDIDDALFALTGVRMYGDVELWKKWWAANRERIARRAAEQEQDQPPGGVEAAGPEEGNESKRKGGTSAFYGIRTLSKRIVFVIDISRSMQDPAKAKPAAATGRSKDRYPAPAGRRKLDIAKWQLHRAIEGLPKEALFGLVVYSESYAAWKNRLVAATPRNKLKAHKFVEGLRGNGTTNICDSLDKAIDLGPDTIFLLSDGDPNRGRLSDLGALLEEFLGRNVGARIVLHAIGIGEAAGSTFLKSLARRTGGRYVGFR